MLVILCLWCVVVLFGCEKQEREKLQLKNTEITIALNAESDLELETNLDEIFFSSSDANIVTVNEKGAIKGVGEGVATITVTGGTLTATFQVTVVEIVGDRAAVIMLNVMKVDLFVGDKFTVEPTLKLGADTIKNPKYTWKSEDETVAKIDNGVITAISAGQTSIIVSSVKYDNTDKEIIVSVRNDYTLDVSANEIELAKVEKFGFKTSSTITCVAKMNGVQVENLHIICSMENPQIANFEKQGDAIIVSAKDYGSTKLKLLWTYGNEEIYTYINLSVVKPTVLAESYDYSVSTQSFDLSYVKGKDIPDDLSTDNIVGVKDETNTQLILQKIDDEAFILSGTELYATSGSEHVLSVDFTDYVIEIPLKCYTLAIRTVDDFQSLPTYFNETEKRVTGYFVLSEDIWFSDTDEEFATYCGYLACGKALTSYGWCATFDGQGHTVENLTLKAGSLTGIFGIIGQQGVVKNVAFANGTNKGHGGYFAGITYGTIQNVFISAYQSAGYNASNAGALLPQEMDKEYSVIENVTVVALTKDMNGYNYTLAQSFANKAAIDGRVVSIG
ncbi:MAG: hypothetical protein IJX75_04945, partial [Clostridia bacterium]|nr:hypothetical protein [Clostridia bacterium]